MENKTCPECVSQIPSGAQVCGQCGVRIEGIRCDACMAMSPQEARKCRWCGNRMSQASQPAVGHFEVGASRIGSLLIRGAIFPQRATFSNEKIVIRTYSTFGLTSNDEEILWEKVAGFSHRNGMIWDRVSIETRGQTQAVIACLSKSNSRRIREVLQGLEK
ncbi:MAG: ribosomal protein L40E [Planctomycetota bacterium]|jgi:ribosomal protein L40E